MESTQPRFHLDGRSWQERMGRPCAGLGQQLMTELRLFWRSRQTIYLAFLVPMLGMALFVYLNREGLLDRAFGALFRGLGTGAMTTDVVSPMTLMTLGLVVYIMVDVAFESAVPRLVRERSMGLGKRLGGTPLRTSVFLMAKTLSSALVVLLEVMLILAVGLVSTDLNVIGSWWLLGMILILGTFTTSALGFVLSTVVSSADGAVLAVHAIYIPMLFLCGAFIPVEALPRGLQILARALPLTYFVLPFREVLVQGCGVIDVGTDLLVLVGWLAIGWAMAIKTSRWE